MIGINGFRLLISARKPALVAVVAVMTPLLAHAQAAKAQASGAESAAASAASTANATLAERSPVIDGKDDDEVWRTATPITGFRVFDPAEDGDPSFQTEAKIAYDAENLYVFTRMFDPHPDSIVALLSRRDVKTQSEQIKVMVDS